MAEKKGFNLSQVLKDVSNLDTGANPAAPQQIELIPLALIDQDQNNFYSLDGIDQLASSIELLGLQQPILVRPSGGGRYTVISGHRRRAAAMLINDGGSDQFKAGVPCIVDRSEASAALRELQLIYANANTRELTSAEKSKQAERVEMLLYELKSQGVEFPGRMRDHVAEACNMSKTKLARLKVIRDKLAPVWLKKWNANELNESFAYELAQFDAAFQERIFRVRATAPASSLSRIRVAVQDGEDWSCSSLQCPNGEPCSHADAALRHDLEERREENCCYGKVCCVKCDKATRNWSPCNRMCSKAKAARSEINAKEKAAEEKRVQKEKNKLNLKIQTSAARLVRAADAAGIANNVGIPSRYGGYTVGRIRQFADGDFTEGPSFSNPFDPKETLFVPQAAKALKCSADYICGFTDDLTPVSAAPVALQWHTGAPTEQGLYAARFDCGGVVIRNIVQYFPHLQCFSFPHGARIDAECIGWIKLPEDDNG